MDYTHLEQQIKEGDIVALSRAITLAESTRAADNHVIDQILSRQAEASDKSLVLSISGIPGVGKSTFIESLGIYVLSLNFKIAVFSIDPTSEVTSGSILGDKTRMTELSRHPNVFIRPSPSSNVLGGLGLNTHKNIALAKLAGFDIILVETVGVGQSETMVKQLSDLFILLQMPSSGDELQGIKKGIMEVADFFIIHKADGDLIDAANQSKREIESALHLTREEDMTEKVYTYSSLTSQGIDTIWTAIYNRFINLQSTGDLASIRQDQQLYWLKELWQRESIAYMQTRYASAYQQLIGRVKQGEYITASDLRSIWDRLSD